MNEAHRFKNYLLKSNYSSSVFDYVIHEIFTEEIYRFKSQKNNHIILDIGANIGLTSLFFKELYPDSEIIVFEPDPSSFLCLKENLNGLNIQMNPFAVSNSNGSSKFYVNENSAKNFPVASLHQNEFSQKEINVEVVDIVDIISKLECIDFCKIDVEGEESNIIEGLINGKLINKVQEYIIEYHFWVKQKYSLKQILQLFYENGFNNERIKEEKWNGYKNCIIRFYK